MTPFLPIDRLRTFSADGNIYRAFNHLIAARSGALLLIPISLWNFPWHLRTGEPSTVGGYPIMVRTDAVVLPSGRPSACYCNNRPWCWKRMS